MFAEWLKLVGETIIVAGIITGTYEIMVREETEGYLLDTIGAEFSRFGKDLKGSIEERMPRIVAESLLLNKDIQKRVLASGRVDEVLLTCLSTRLGKEMSQELLAGVINPVLHAFDSSRQRVMYDYDIRIQLERAAHPDVAKSFYALHLTVEYTYKLNIPQFRFACAISRDAFRKLLDDPTFTYVYYLPASNLGNLPFQVTDIRLQHEGMIVPLTKTAIPVDERMKEFSFGASDLPEYVGKECRLVYSISTLIRKNGHMYFVSIKHPIRNLKATFDSGDTGITDVSVSDQFVSSGGMILTEQASGGRIIRVASVAGWVFPNSGVTFVWD